MENLTEAAKSELLINNLKQFASLSSTLVGVENTSNVLAFFSGLIAKSPELYQKMFEPERIEKLVSLADEISKKGDKLNTLSALSYAPKIIAIFK